jgi:hypothetical protein
MNRTYVRLGPYHYNVLVRGEIIGEIEQRSVRFALKLRPMWSYKVVGCDKWEVHPKRGEATMTDVADTLVLIWAR